MHLFRVDQFLEPALCERIQAAMNEGIAEPAEIVTDDPAGEPAGGMVIARDIRRANEIEIDPVLLGLIESRLDSIRGSVEASFGRALGDREGASVLRYPTGGFYRTHQDRGENPDWPDVARRAIALVVFLNSADAGDLAFSGGTLRLWSERDEPCDVVPRAGTLVAFPATTLHEVLPVTAGTRDTVVDWFYDA